MPTIGRMVPQKLSPRYTVLPMPTNAMLRSGSDDRDGEQRRNRRAQIADDERVKRPWAGAQQRSAHHDVEPAARACRQEQLAGVVGVNVHRPVGAQLLERHRRAHRDDACGGRAREQERRHRERQGDRHREPAEQRRVGLEEDCGHEDERELDRPDRRHRDPRRREGDQARRHHDHAEPSELTGSRQWVVWQTRHVLLRSLDCPRHHRRAASRERQVRARLQRFGVSTSQQLRHLSGRRLVSNRLAAETSPYLLQHAENPVDWYPWGPEAFAEAREHDKPVFLSVGYSACHWCHVMEHESFEDEATAALMNRHFVSVKVDREERPDVDAIYMEAVQALSGSGGWPMSVFLTPDGEPFYGGTYFPDTPRFGMPSFTELLSQVADLWETRRDEVLAAGASLTEELRRQASGLGAAGNAQPGIEVLSAAQKELSASFDREYCGWGLAPKFPQPAVLEFLLRRFLVTGNERPLEMVQRTLDAMMRGGIYDQVGGGFHRYATDQRWLVPHFEKMLYDNAQLARVYLHAWQITGNDAYRRVVTETLDYVVREMLDPDGGFYSAQDADTEGEEGRFFVWEPDEIRAVLSAVREGRPTRRILRGLRRRSVLACVRNLADRQLRGSEHPVPSADAGRDRHGPLGERRRDRCASLSLQGGAVRRAREPHEARRRRQGPLGLERADARGFR